ncbi:MAG: DegT/DnrJ/EryC1/StrS family aminotransferase [Flavobacteriaceae bacterium]|nr:DegT/DnrJ/EryC1/StrS family aminotransferase [Flavobacteriaceae bacterium]
MIPFFDLKTYNQQYKNEIDAAIEQVLASGRYILGEQVERFEHEYASYCGTTYCIGTGNGMDALLLIFKAWIELGLLEPGDEVMVPANTYIASILPVIHARLKPVFVEPDIETFNLDPEKLDAALSSKTKVIMAVHLYGQLADMKAINSFAKAHGLLVVEDAAQGHGASGKDNKKAGNLSDAAGFSFYPTKNLGALGDAGAVTTNNDELAAMLRKLRDYGRSTKYLNELAGINSRLDEFQAAVLNVKLASLDRDNEKRRKLAGFYLDRINNQKLKLPFYSGAQDHVFHQFVLRTPERERFIGHLNKHGIGTLVHYPVPPHKQKALKPYNELSLNITEQIHNEVVSIPLNPTLSMGSLETVVNHINTF